MRLLVLGGTARLGGVVAAAALERGHDVTCLARGRAGEVPPGADLVLADRDRDDALDEVRHRDWDAVVDVARQPGHVRRAAGALADRAGVYVFVSSASVYADDSARGADERAAVHPPLDGDVMESMAVYGPAKVACERHVLAAFGAARSVVARMGLIGGPGDVSDRTGYWPLRFARPASDDGAVLVPDSPDLMTQVVDVRDLAAWLLDVAGGGVRGTYNVMGDPLPLPTHLDAAREVSGHRGPLVPVDQEWLLAHGVEPWMGERSLPLWLPLPDYAGFTFRDTSAVRQAGLATRPLQETLADTLAWELAAGPGRPRRAGLSDADERALLAEARA